MKINTDCLAADQQPEGIHRVGWLSCVGSIDGNSQQIWIIPSSLQNPGGMKKIGVEIPMKEEASEGKKSRRGLNPPLSETSAKEDRLFWFGLR